MEIKLNKRECSMIMKNSVAGIALLMGLFTSVAHADSELLKGRPVIYGTDCTFSDHDSGQFSWDMPKGNYPTDLKMIIEETPGTVLRTLDATERKVKWLKSGKGTKGYYAYFDDGKYKSQASLVFFDSGVFKCTSGTDYNGDGTLTWPDSKEQN
ncbi:MAG: hypothetical protein P4L95_23305 [Rouxiella aceris]|jgi:hypothetical protein|uniref:hypothetical protein n=1 Tax=Rouxiella aceris TaxID=2703884 RepID=UPI0028503DC9|nr:hypothetical protein [Rouxiella aceris]MDR3434793.1 hypothetical protein [Rouxiella aceris]